MLEHVKKVLSRKNGGHRQVDRAADDRLTKLNDKKKQLDAELRALGVYVDTVRD